MIFSCEVANFKLRVQFFVASRHWQRHMAMVDFMFIFTLKHPILFIQIFICNINQGFSMKIKIISFLAGNRKQIELLLLIDDFAGMH